MTDREKIAQIIAEHLCPQGKSHKTLYGAERMCYSYDNFAECEKISECVDALLEAGIGDIKRIANEERKQAVQEFVEEFKSRYFFMMTTYMKDPIYQCTGDEIDRLVKEVCGE